MLKKLALKKLKPSDLSFFSSYLTQHDKNKQKAFNLDSRLMQSEQFFPSLKAMLQAAENKEALISLSLFGPGLTERHSLARKIRLDAKNIRLNGEIVHGPLTQPDRYDVMAPGDFAIMEFTGTAVPTAARVVLIAAADPNDFAIHAALTALLPDEADSMEVLSAEKIESIIDLTKPSPDHPIRIWLDTAMLEELGNGDAVAVERLNLRRPGRGMSLIDLKASKISAERTGRLGEELLNQFFLSPSLPGLLRADWIADVNAISPFDFLLDFGSSNTRHADAKSTSGQFSNPVYLSIAEIRHAVNSGVPYDIFRLYEVKEETATLRIAFDVGPQLVCVLDSLKALPELVRVDALSFDPAFFNFEKAVHTVEISSEQEEEESH